MASMQNMLKQAQKLQEDMEASQKRLETEVLKVSSGGGAVTFEITGSQKFQGCTLSEDLLKEDKATIEAAILAGAREAIESAKKMHEEEMKKITSGLNLPGMGDMAGGGMPSSDGPRPRASQGGSMPGMPGTQV